MGQRSAARLALWDKVVTWLRLDMNTDALDAYGAYLQVGGYISFGAMLREAMRLEPVKEESWT